MTQKRREIPRWAVCSVCREKWAQSNSGLCRRCDRNRAAGEADLALAREVVHPTRAKVLQSRHYEPPDAGEVRPVREVDGVLYVVTWCGTDAGGEALGIPPAHLRGCLTFNPSRLERYHFV